MTLESQLVEKNSSASPIMELKTIVWFFRVKNNVIIFFHHLHCVHFCLILRPPPVTIQRNVAKSLRSFRTRSCGNLRALWSHTASAFRVLKLFLRRVKVTAMTSSSKRLLRVEKSKIVIAVLWRCGLEKNADCCCQKGSKRRIGDTVNGYRRKQAVKQTCLMKTCGRPYWVGKLEEEDELFIN